MNIIDNIETAAQSATATVCDNAALFGAAPERDEFDTREVWDEDDALDAHGKPLPFSAPRVSFLHGSTHRRGRTRYMSRENFIATAWHNGSPTPGGAGYGLKIGIADRDRFFDRSWQTVTLRLAAQRSARTAEVNCAKASFWNGTCRELIGKEIGRWFIDNGFAPWRRGSPPRFRFSPAEARVFDVTALSD